MKKHNVGVVLVSVLLATQIGLAAAESAIPLGSDDLQARAYAWVGPTYQELHAAGTIAHDVQAHAGNAR